MLTLSKSRAIATEYQPWSCRRPYAKVGGL